MLQLSQRPLRSSEADAALFVDREAELNRLGRALELRLNSLLLGQRGAGKTSLLHQLERRIRNWGPKVHLIEASRATTLDDLVDVLRAGVTGPPPRQLAFSLPLLFETPPPDVADKLGQLATRLQASSVVLLDGVPDPSLAQRLFGQHRDELWQLPITWVVAGHLADRQTYLDPPADAFFDSVVELGELSTDAAAELLLRRATAPGTKGDAAAEALAGIAPSLAEAARPRTPRQVLAGARGALLAEEGPVAALATRQAMRRRAADLGQAAAALLADLEAHGPLSASDEGALARLGWTRARAVQVFRQLEEAGLVVATSERVANRPGRPRRAYDLNPRYPTIRTEEAP